MLKILTSLHGRLFGLTPAGVAMSRNGFVGGGDDKPAIHVPGDPRSVAYFNDFIGATGADTGTVYVHNNGDDVYKGISDTGQLHSRQGLTNGVLRMTASATSAQEPIAGVMTINTLGTWKANQGRLRMGARVKMTAIAGENVFVGFSDTGQAEMPAYDTGAGILTPAADYLGFLYSGETSTLQALGWRGVAGKAGTDQTATFSATQSVTANVYDELQVDVNDAGNLARFFVNGKIVGQIASAAITPTVALTAMVAHSNTDAAATSVDVDWIAVSAARDTGT